MTLVSIVIPTFNRAELLRETAESALAQKHRPLELVVVDDGSTDHTLAVTERLKTRSTRSVSVRIITQSNRGEARAVNRGFAAASGDVIGVVNSDDPVEPRLAGAAVAALRAEPARLAVYPAWRVIDQNGQTRQTVTPPRYAIRTLAVEHHCLPGPGAMLTRRALAMVGGRDPAFRFVGDYDFWLRLGIASGSGAAMARIDEPLASWRTHPGSSTTARAGRAMAREHVDITARMLRTPGLPGSIRAEATRARAMARFVAASVCRSDHAARLGHALVFAALDPIGAMARALAPTRTADRLLRGVPVPGARR